jgi:tRNA-Thr(GGU) m(6)t(6)A37 methyltransferase TsaA
MDFVFHPIGVIRSPFVSPVGTPIQSVYAKDTDGDVIVDKTLEPALSDLDGFERIWLVYALDRACAFKPRVIPYRDTREHGLFATRSPNRPNPIGLSVVQLVHRNGHVLRVRGLDILDATPLLDIKPYVPEFDSYPTAKAGWFEDCNSNREVADARFHDLPPRNSFSR